MGDPIVQPSRLILVLGCLATTTASATPIEFIHKGRGSGKLANVAFPDSAFLIRAFGDTNDRYGGPNTYAINHTKASIEIVGLGLIRFNVPTATYVATSLNRVGFKRATAGNLFDGPVDTALAGWDMLTGIGPVYGVGQLLQWDGTTYGTIQTDRGILYFDNGISESTFQATIVPAPASLALPCVLLVWRRRRPSPSLPCRTNRLTVHTPQHPASNDATN